MARKNKQPRKKDLDQLTRMLLDGKSAKEIKAEGPDMAAAFDWMQKAIRPQPSGATAGPKRSSALSGCGAL